MDFILTTGFELAGHLRALASHKTSLLDTTQRHACTGRLQYFIAGSEASLVEDKRGVGFFDGQTSIDGRFYHSHFVRQDLGPLLAKVRFLDGDPSAGVFCAGRLARTEAGSTRVFLTTDWAGQYPVYFWRHGYRAVLSNNLLMMEAVLGARRNALPAVLNLASMGGSWRETHLDDVHRLDVGYYVSLTPDTGLELKRRPDHDGAGCSYEEAIVRARDDIRSHVSAAMKATPGACTVTDLTGGADSRAVLALLQGHSDRSFSARCMGMFPSPDANVAAYLMDRLGLEGATYPIAQLPQQVAVRQNAVISGGARESGSMVCYSVYPDLVHFKGTFGELGGANAGIDYIGLALEDEHFSFGAALDRLFERQKRVGILRFLTAGAVALVRDQEARNYELLETMGYARETLFAERYIRVKCRSHFGLVSCVANKNHVSPDPLANRWLVEARRCLSPAVYRHNKVIYDLISQSNDQGLEFMPMAGNKWHRTIIPDPLLSRWEAMEVVGFDSENLTGRTSRLFRNIPVPQQTPTLKLLPLSIKAQEASIVPQAVHQQTNLAFIRFFLEHFSPAHDCWKWFDRNELMSVASGEEQDGRNDGMQTVTLGIIASALCWLSGMELKPQVQQHLSLNELLAGHQ